jgi:hypothetical protein
MSPREQISQEDTLVDRGVDDALDEGYSPPERRPASHDVGTTAEEMRQGETWDQRLAQEEPDLDPSVLPTSSDEDRPQVYGEEAGARAGRLVAPDEGAHEDAEKDEVARDVGIDGGAASAEEAAVHVIPEEDLP